ncbi:MAG: serine/threonine-protein phosphatase [Planctomycetes bacterium]|nr:serine/threonine-protein phosphatase [Planctomycetota bacterium]
MNVSLHRGGADAECEHLEIGNGHVVVLSRRSPAKETENEDAALVLPLEGDRAVLAVADGMGGLPAGGEASRIALTQLAEVVATREKEGGELRHAILDGFDQANRAVLAMGVGAATTLAVVEIMGSTMRSYHVGDSAIVLVGQRGKLKHQSVAHSPVGYAIEAGVIDEEEAIDHDERHVVSNAVGDTEMRLEIGPVLVMAPRDTLVIASDGLFDNLRTREICDAVRVGPILRCGQRLAQASAQRMGGTDAEHPSKPDDLTFLLFRRAIGTMPGEAPADR